MEKKEMKKMSKRLGNLIGVDGEGCFKGPGIISNRVHSNPLLGPGMVTIPRS